MIPFKPSVSPHLAPHSISVVEESINSPNNLANTSSLANGPLPLELSNNNKFHELDMIPLGSQSIEQVLLDPQKLCFFVINNAFLIIAILTNM